MFKGVSCVHASVDVGRGRSKVSVCSIWMAAVDSVDLTLFFFFFFLFLYRKRCKIQHNHVRASHILCTIPGMVNCFGKCDCPNSGIFSN